MLYLIRLLAVLASVRSNYKLVNYTASDHLCQFLVYFHKPVTLCKTCLTCFSFIAPLVPQTEMLRYPCCSLDSSSFLSFLVFKSCSVCRDQLSFMLALVFVVNFIGAGCFWKLTQKVVEVLAQDILS